MGFWEGDEPEGDGRMIKGQRKEGWFKSHDKTGWRGLDLLVAQGHLCDGRGPGHVTEGQGWGKREHCQDGRGPIT